MDVGTGRGERSLQTDVDAVRVGHAAAARVLRRSRHWWHEAEDVRQDAALGALAAWREDPTQHAGYLFSAAMNAVLQPRLGRRFRADGRLGVGLSETTDPWAQAEAAIAVGQLAEGLTPRGLQALQEDGGGRSDPAHYQARCRALNYMRARAA